MRHGSLFSGIGGFDLAAEWMGWENVFHCEKNPFGQKVLKHHFPNSESFDDITKTDFTKYYGTIDLISGGFPCQPYSIGGKRKGKDDDRHLFPEMLRAIREIAPRWVVGENVRGLTNWNKGMVFDEVCSDLEALGYKVTACLIPAVAVNAPHKRERIWIIAYNEQRNLTNSEYSRLEGHDREWQGCAKHWEDEGLLIGAKGEQLASDSNNTGLQGREINRNSTEKKREGKFYRDFARQNCGKWENFPSQSPICGGDDGLPTKLDGITFSKWRTESLMAYGNAVVPQIVYEIFKSIEEYELLHNT